MERRAFILSLSLASLAMYLVYQYIDGVDKDLQDQYGVSYPMVVASRDILQFQTLRPTDIEVIKVPKALYHPGMITDPRHVIDAVAAVPIVKGEQIFDNKVISKNFYSGLDTQVSLNRRAISIPASIKSSAGYLLRPGNRVDLAAHFEYRSGQTNISEVKSFLQDLLVLAVGRTIQPSPPKGVDQSLFRKILGDGKGDPIAERVVKDTLDFAKSDPTFTTVTLEVTPQQAQTIVHVMTLFGDTMNIFLRGSDDRVVERKNTTNLLDVMGPDSFLGRGPKAPPQRAVALPKFNDLVGGDPIPVPK